MMPKQGNKAPWKNYQNYLIDIFAVRLASIDDSNLKFDDYKSKWMSVFWTVIFINLIPVLYDGGRCFKSLDNLITLAS